MKYIVSILLACAFGGAVAGMSIPAAAQTYVQMAPPAPRYEQIPSPPGASYYWEPGYWSWNGYRYVWVHGHYGYRPYSGAIWRPGHWRQGPNGWYWVPGHWRAPY
jgi:hypothetical protein